jgi:Tfp pilus assembly protein PilO
MKIYEREIKVRVLIKTALDYSTHFPPYSDEMGENLFYQELPYNVYINSVYSKIDEFVQSKTK